MQQVFEKLLKGFVPRLCRAERIRTERLRETSARLLRELKDECPPQVFRKICRLRRAHGEYCRRELKDAFGAGVLYGILTGIETVCGFGEGKSLLGALLNGQSPEQNEPSEESLACWQTYLLLSHDLEKELPKETFLKANEAIDDEAAAAFSYAKAYYGEGARKGIPLGIAAGRLAESLR